MTIKVQKNFEALVCGKLIRVFLILIAALLILFWAVLKIIGVINSPVWVDMIPFFGIGLAIIGGVYKLGKIMRGIEDTEEKIDSLLQIKDRFSKIEHEHNLALNGKLKIRR